MSQTRRAGVAKAPDRLDVAVLDEENDVVQVDRFHDYELLELDDKLLDDELLELTLELDELERLDVLLLTELLLDELDDADELDERLLDELLDELSSIERIRSTPPCAKFDGPGYSMADRVVNRSERCLLLPLPRTSVSTASHSRLSSISTVDVVSVLPRDAVASSVRGSTSTR